MRDYFSAYLESITNAYGPHTSYLPPEEKEDFDINMSGQLKELVLFYVKKMVTLKWFVLFREVHLGGKGCWS